MLCFNDYEIFHRLEIVVSRGKKFPLLSFCILKQNAHFPYTIPNLKNLMSFEILVQNLDCLFKSKCLHTLTIFMLNLEPGGCEPFIGCFPDWSFFFLRRLSPRGMFRLFYAAYKGGRESKSKFLQ